MKRSLLSPFLTSRPHCWRKQKYRVDGQSVNYAALYQYERDAKPFDNPKVREALNYAINRPALVKVAFAGYATPATGVVPPSIAYAQSYKPWPYDPVKARELLKEAGYPNGFSTTLWSSHNHSTAQKVLQFTQQQLAQVGIKARVTAMDAGQRAAEVEGKGQKRAACGCSTLAGRLQPAKLTGHYRRCLHRKTGHRRCLIPRFTAINRWMTSGSGTENE